MNQLMPKASLVVAAIVAASFSFSVQAEKHKLSGTAGEVAAPVQSTPYKGENPTRDIVQRVAVFLWMSDSPDWDGIVETSPQQNMTVGGMGYDVGHIVFHHRNGDEAYGYFLGTYKVVTKADGSWEVPFEGQKIIVGGTGRLANIKGTLNYKGKATPAGATFRWEGEVDY